MSNSVNKCKCFKLKNLKRLPYKNNLSFVEWERYLAEELHV